MRTGIPTLALGAAMLVFAGLVTRVDAVTSLAWTPFSSATYLELEKSGRPFVIEFTADWCQPCMEMKETTFRDPRVVEAARGIGLLQVDMTVSDRRTELAQKSFKVLGAPTLIFMGPGGTERARKIGFVPAEQMVDALLELKKPAAEPSPDPPSEQRPEAPLEQI
jgi:thiol:disulfide interchange protein DsbD